jgi:oxygen-independent coproporphyrinogen-3 oxidase
MQEMPHSPRIRQPGDSLFKSDTAGLYIHFPFCSEQCTYCGFVTRRFQEVKAEAYQRILHKELELLAARYASHADAPPPVNSLYLGGGTPSLISASALSAMCDHLGHLFPMDAHSESEWTIEANPADVTPDRAASWASCGFNRVSVGAQTSSPGLLQRLHRRHSPDDVVRACDILRRSGIPRISLDLIAGLPDQDMGQDLDWILARQPDHISIYMLEVKERTPLEKQVHKGLFQLPDPDVVADQYLQIVQTLSAAGYFHYEISNFARIRDGEPPWSACSRHNLKYWNMQPVWAAGLAAHGFDGIARWAGESNLARYQEKLRQNILPYEWQRKLSVVDLLEESFLMGLRKTAGIGEEELFKRFPAEYVQAVIAALDPFFESGLVRRDPAGEIYLSVEGMLLSNEVFEAVLEALEPFAANQDSQ